MLVEESSLYEIYVHFFGITKSGTKISEKDFCFKTITFDIPFTAAQRISAVLGISDEKGCLRMKTVRQFFKAYNEVLDRGL